MKNWPRTSRGKVCDYAGYTVYRGGVVSNLSGAYIYVSMQ